MIDQIILYLVTEILRFTDFENEGQIENEYSSYCPYSHEKPYCCSKQNDYLLFQESLPYIDKLTTDSNHSEAISPNLLDRQFKVDRPNQVWATDITYVWTWQGWLHVAVVIDLFSRLVVGLAVDDHMCTSLCVQALQMAFWRRKPPAGLLHHSDRGSQYVYVSSLQFIYDMENCKVLYRLLVVMQN